MRLDGSLAIGNFHWKIIPAEFRDNFQERLHCVITALICSIVIRDIKVPKVFPLKVPADTFYISYMDNLILHKVIAQLSTTWQQF